ncbi:TPA: LysM peptidoglycan-binding domain-containing protein, partial [Streptococcus suis]
MKRKRVNKPKHMRRKRKTSILKENKKMMYASSLALSLFTTGVVSTNVMAIEWTPRTVAEIRPEIVQESNQMTYTVKYGDTLSAIASAMNIDMDTLAKINQIADINLIFPDTVLTTTVDQNNQVTQVEIETPSQENPAETVQATVDVTTNQATVDNTVVNLDEVPAVMPTTPVVETQAPAVAEAPAAAAAPVAPAVEVPAEVAAPVAPAAEAPVAAEAQAEAEAQAAAEA